MKVRSLHLSIPQPCHEDWDKMTPTEKGRHCQSCQKEVVDFSALTDQQILDLFAKNSSGLCGRFQSTQLDRQLFLKPASTTTPWAKAGLLAASLLLAVPSIGQQNVSVKTEQVLKKTPSLTNSSSAQLVTGIVVDEEGDPLVHATVLIKGTSTGTITDVDGHFQILVNPVSDTLVFSYVGYSSHEISVNEAGSETLNVEMQQGAFLEEVIVTEYKINRCRCIVGAIASISTTSKRPKRIPGFSALPKTEIKVFPNPFVSQVQIELGNVQEGTYKINIVANTGQVVHQTQLFLSSHQRLEMDLAALNLPAGTYWLQISDGKGQDFKQQLIKVNR